jgi:hypothetical protein
MKILLETASICCMVFDYVPYGPVSDCPFVIMLPILILASYLRAKKVAFLVLFISKEIYSRGSVRFGAIII